MGRAYRYAEERGPKPPEYEAGQLVDRFGAAVVFGGTMRRRDMHDILLVETIVTAYRQLEKAESWAEWAQDNPQLSELLAEAKRAAD